MPYHKQYGYEIYKEAYDRLGSARKAAIELGVNPSTVQRSLNTGREREARAAGMEPGVAEALQKAGHAEPEALHSGWVRKQQEDGSFTSVYFFNGKEEKPATDFIEEVREAFSSIIPQPRQTPLPDSDEDLLTVYPIPDAHIGMLAWSQETGESYDTRIAEQRICSWMEEVVDGAPKSAEAVIIDVGDLTHADDQKNITPGGGHQLDVDTRQFKTLDVTIQTLVHCTNVALTKHQTVTVVILKGNHNPHAYMTILFALHAYYRDEPRVKVLKQPGDFFVMQWGKVLIAANHGDKAKVENTVMMLADKYRSLWATAQFVYLFTAHKHHMKAADIGGVVWEQLRAVTSADYYAASHAWLGKPQISAITYHKERGVRSRVYCGQ